MFSKNLIYFDNTKRILVLKGSNSKSFNQTAIINHIINLYIESLTQMGRSFNK